MGTAGVGVIVLFAGYSVAYYGLTQLQGGNWGLLDLVVPSRWQRAKDTPRDNPQLVGRAAGAGTATGPAPPVGPAGIAG